MTHDQLPTDPHAEEDITEAEEEAGFDLDTDVGHPHPHPGAPSYDVTKDLGYGAQPE